MGPGGEGWERIMQEHRDVIEQFFRYVKSGERHRVPELWSDDIVLHYGGDNPVSGTYRGRAEVGRAYRTMAELTDGTFGVVELHDMLASDDHVVVLTRVGAERQGHRLEWAGIDVYHVADGRIQEIWIHVTDQYAVDEFLTR